jgi:hypothetical protein
MRKLFNNLAEFSILDLCRDAEACQLTANLDMLLPQLDFTFYLK